MANKFSTATTEQKEDGANALSDVLFDGNNDDAVKDWLHEHLEYRLPGAEKILASDKDFGKGATIMPDEELPKILIDLFSTEIFAGGTPEQEGGYHLRDLILDIMFEKGEYNKIQDIWCGSTSNAKTRDEKTKHMQRTTKALQRRWWKSCRTIQSIRGCLAKHTPEDLSPCCAFLEFLRE